MFLNLIAEDLYERTGVQQCIMSPYHPQANELGERVNRPTTDRFKTMIWEQADWVDALQTVAWIHRSTCHVSTNYEPLRIMLGYKPKLPCECMNWGTDITKIRDLTEEEVEDIIPQTKKENVKILMQLRKDVLMICLETYTELRRNRRRIMMPDTVVGVNSFRLETAIKINMVNKNWKGGKFDKCFTWNVCCRKFPK